MMPEAVSGASSGALIAGAFAIGRAGDLRAVWTELFGSRVSDVRVLSPIASLPIGAFDFDRGATLETFAIDATARASLPKGIVNGCPPASRRSHSLGLDEREQISVDLVLVRGAHAVRQAWIDFQRRSFDQLG